MLKNDKSRVPETTPVTLRMVADHVGLAPCSISAVLNNSPAAAAIPQRTKDRVLRAVRQLNYRPNLTARGLRTKRTHTVALMASDLGNVRVARLISGVEAFLREKGYLLVITTCDRSGNAAQAEQLLQRGIEGVITIDATLPKSVALALVFIDLPCSDVPEPITHLKRERLTAMGEAAAQSLLVQIEQKTGYLTRISLAPETSVGLLPTDAGISIHKLTLVERFAD